ncbi:PREDICTED: WASH complex subunit CCDC53 homolog isoform X2 [Drosophila arizonae]|uniref:WASH complex subunit CCDC53 homolog isoform X2 n=1 Tax=Drosophila arizonae TaxID=7263 RepID=A0ABM1NZH5_DROAR|nr:PREDICTED: WASH complex subunit CCDC53 homolog isoform X2 [Drosophila arizonae]
MEASAAFTGDVDKTQIPPLNQKRILAFVNHFLLSTCNFLNEFALNCETKFVRMERQLQRTEAALIILETKLASIPVDKEVDNSTTTSEANTEATTNATDKPEVEPPAEIKGVRVCEDIRYKKYFKMLQVGVPAPAVKIKMSTEGLDSEMLE